MAGRHSTSHEPTMLTRDPLVHLHVADLQEVPAAGQPPHEHREPLDY